MSLQSILSDLITYVVSEAIGFVLSVLLLLIYFIVTRIYKFIKIPIIQTNVISYLKYGIFNNPYRKINGKYVPKSKKYLKILLSDENVFLGDIDVTKVTDMSELFSDINVGNYEGIHLWDVSNVTNMKYMFKNKRGFNEDISSWNVSNVTNMEGMFHKASSFNRNISSWDVSNVINMSKMFYGAEDFNQPIGSWNVSNVTNMSFMFSGAESFNQDLSGWNVSNVKSMGYMFLGIPVSNNPPAWYKE